jgi:hypothetical protein
LLFNPGCYPTKKEPALMFDLIFISSSSPVQNCRLSYDDNRRAIGFDVGIHRLSPGKAGTGRGIDHAAEIFFARESATTCNLTGSADTPSPASQRQTVTSRAAVRID